MARLSISEAARQAGISRQYLHTKYIKPGTLTAFKDELDRPYIDSADLLRVFNGRLPGPKTAVTPDDGILHQQGLHNSTPSNDSINAGLQATVEVLQEQLRAAQERERWYQGQMESLSGALKLLEHRSSAPAHDPAAESRAKEQAAILDAERTRSKELEAALEAERTRSTELAAEREKIVADTAATIEAEHTKATALEAQREVKRSGGFFSWLFPR